MVIYCVECSLSNGSVVDPCVAQSAYGWNEMEKLSQHASQTDATRGFGGKYGVEKDKQDKVF